MIVMVLLGLRWEVLLPRLGKHHFLTVALPHDRDRLDAVLIVVGRVEGAVVDRDRGLTQMDQRRQLSLPLDVVLEVDQIVELFLLLRKGRNNGILSH